jgi:ATP-dependent RNA helicase RhlE
MFNRYKNNNRNRRPYQGSNRGKRQFFGGRKIASFDPSYIVNAPKPENTNETYMIKNNFSDFYISASVLKNIKDKGYLIPTPIQDQAIPAILAGRDVLGKANTGTGKTAAFLIPLIEKVLKNRDEKILILTPTRELADQIKNELRAFTTGLNIYAALCIGGENIKGQIYNLSRFNNFVIGTPGRIEDLISRGHLNLQNFRTVVLDEADHMVDIGFLPSIKRMIGMLPQKRQSLFFSATVNDKVKSIIASFVHNPLIISVPSANKTANINQKIIRISPPNTKVDELMKMLRSDEFHKILIFGRTKHGVQKLTEKIVDSGFKADSIHGNKNQNQRGRVIDKFKKDIIQILIATDVASRGLDIPDVSHVINFDLPATEEAYIHRIGRTGRANKTGFALTFIE